MKNYQLADGVKNLVTPELLNYKKASFQLKRVRIIRWLKQRIEEVEELNPDKAEDFQNYQVKRITLCEKYAMKDSKDLPKIVDGKYIFGTNKKSFESELEKLNAEFKETLETYKTGLKNYENCLNEEVDDIITFKDSEIPDDINDNIMIIEPFIRK